MIHLETTEQKNAPTKAAPPAPRYTNPGFHVSVRTIGTRISFAMPVANVSTSGMLLQWSSVQRSPFAVNTILEMEIQHPTSQGHRKVDCLGKVVRRVLSPDGAPTFGVKIIQAETDEREEWLSLMTSLDPVSLTIDEQATLKK